MMRHEKKYKESMFTTHDILNNVKGITGIDRETMFYN